MGCCRHRHRGRCWLRHDCRNRCVHSVVVVHCRCCGRAMNLQLPSRWQCCKVVDNDWDAWNSCQVVVMTLTVLHYRCILHRCWVGKRRLNPTDAIRYWQEFPRNWAVGTIGTGWYCSIPSRHPYRSLSPKTWIRSMSGVVSDLPPTYPGHVRDWLSSSSRGCRVDGCCHWTRYFRCYGNWKSRVSPILVLPLCSVMGFGSDWPNLNNPSGNLLSIFFFKKGNNTKNVTCLSTMLFLDARASSA